LRKAAAQLSDKWRLRRDGDGHVDLLIIHDLEDPASVPMPLENGQRRVRLIDPVFGAAGMETALWPLSQEKLVRLFNLTGFAADMQRPVAPPAPAIQHNVYDDLFDNEPSGRWQVAIDDEVAATPLDDDHTLVAQARAREAELMREAEQFFRHDAREDHKQALKAIRLHESVDVEATEGKTLPSVARVDRRAALGEFADTTITLTPHEANLRYPLLDFLTGRMLPGPAAVNLDNLALTLDPRNKLYFARGALCIFEDGCRLSLRRGDWRGLTAMEFGEIRRAIEPRPYAELIWLCVYANDSTRPEFELEDEMRYRLTQSLELGRDFPRAARVAQELAKGCTLVAAANLARVPLAEARRVAAAFDAVSFLVPD
jgi:hypothetical protein